MKYFFRFLKNNPLYAVINVVGLALSLMFVILIGDYTYRQFSIDKWHRNHERIYVLGTENGNSLLSWPDCAHSLKDRYPEVEDVCCVYMHNGKIKHEDKVYEESQGDNAGNIMLADSNFFRFFDFKMIDGDRETYLRMRGRDGYDKVIRVVEGLKNEVPVSLMFCLSPWNDFEDMRFVIDVAKKYGIDVRVGIYGTMSFFDTTGELLETDAEDYLRRIPENIHDTEENYDFVALYDEWRNGRLLLRCQSIFSSLVVHSNGDVPLCQNLGVTLGNIHKESLDGIFNSKRARKLQCAYSAGCNGCWINFHRKYDIILMRNLERIFPKRLIEVFYGKYNWSSLHGETYHRYFKRVKNM
jgi:hypothetical protein